MSTLSKISLVSVFVLALGRTVTAQELTLACAGVYEVTIVQKVHGTKKYKQPESLEVDISGQTGFIKSNLGITRVEFNIHNTPTKFTFKKVSVGHDTRILSQDRTIDRTTGKLNFSSIEEIYNPILKSWDTLYELSTGNCSVVTRRQKF